MCFPIQDSVYSLFSPDDQALKLLGFTSLVLFYSGLGLLSSLLRTKYCNFYVSGRLVPGVSFLSWTKDNILPCNSLSQDTFQHKLGFSNSLCLEIPL